MSVYHDEIEIEDFDYDEETETYYYPCPCGDRFQITKEELASGEETATCPSCSLVVKVIYDPEDYVDYEEEEMGIMAGRGRGGRGRGRGMTLEQLGVQRGEVLPDSIVGPPETYPPLEFRPCQPPQKESVEEYILCIKKEFQEHMQNSKYCIQPEVKNPDIERYSDRYQVLASHRGHLSLNWSRFPKELHPMTASVTKKRKLKSVKVAVNLKKARTKDVNVKETLEELEKKEAKLGIDEPEEEEEGDHANKPEEEIEEELEEVDEELDEGTDYVNNYFDNGEDYIDEEDDALEEGGVF